MKNRDIYQRDPSKSKLENDGWVRVEDDNVLRYELETFVCDGQYEKGLEHILDTYLRNIDQAQQPAVWVSGFYGSGKSHLVKMLRALWVDTQFEDGTSARGVADLPTNVHDLLKELSIQGKRHGGLHAASGTLGAGSSGSVRLSLLRIVFRSAGLPEHYPVARFVMWLRDEEIYEEVRTWVETNGYDWEEELANFHVSEGLPKALVNVKPELYSSPDICLESLNNAYPYVQDISNTDMTEAIRHAFTREGIFPLTLIALDEVQQYIGEDSQRAGEVQEAVEACCKGIGGKLLFIGTGQTAVTGTPNLKKLEGRFTVRIELSDADVEVVVRKVVLAKKPDAIDEVGKVMENNLGEISRQLADTSIGHRQEDLQYFTQDYPILPVRSRFWEKTHRVLDPTGTDSQLRNQLSMVHKVIQTNLDKPLGNVVPADYLYFDAADRLLQARVLPRTVYEKTTIWKEGSEEERLTARACGLVFLINKLAGSNEEVGISANTNTIADLMVEDLSSGSGSLRSKLPDLLDDCEILMKVGDEYRIQTEESAAWNDEFLSESNRLASESYRVNAERNERIRRQFRERVNLKLTQGDSRVSRELHPTFDPKIPGDSDKSIYVWVRDEWIADAESVRADALQAGNQSPTVFVSIPKRSADDLRRNIIDFKAASATLDRRGVPSTPGGTEARASVETIKQTSESKIHELIDEAFSNARVFQGGGNEISGSGLQEMVLEAAENSVQRLYPKFTIADNPNWDKVYSSAQKGSPDALKAIGYKGEPAKNDVCKAILGQIAGGKKGVEIREYFEASPYGWPRDAIDGGLQVLLIAGSVLAQDERGRPIAPDELKRKQIGKTIFKVESKVVLIKQVIEVRKLLQQMGCPAKQGEELETIPEFLDKLNELADRAGGEAPKPERPDTASLEEVRLTVGNERLLAVYNQCEELKNAIDEWADLANLIESRWQSWQELKELLSHAGDMEAVQEVRQQAEAIEQQRLLLADPDPIKPLRKSLEDSLRKELVSKQEHFSKELDGHRKQLEVDKTWKELTEDERQNILQECGIVEFPKLSVGTYEKLVSALERYPIYSWSDRTDALTGRFSRAHELAARALEPEIQMVGISRRTLKTQDDVEAWITDLKKKLQAALKKGPVIMK